MALLDNGNHLVRSHTKEWKALDEPGVTGIDLKVLRYDEDQRRAPTMLLRFAPGARYPAHDHPGGEEVFVLEGNIQIGDVDLNAGDYLYTAPGNSHPVRSDGGCVILVNIPEEVRKLDE
ncbi:MAG: cupin domain-containing protein [candidate division Zixibacteria bacterium]|nr:cupin domain-containing protein [candidate division Zixibacteria bacterium]